MHLLEARISETELVIEETLEGSLLIVRRYRRKVLLREAARCLANGLATILALILLSGMMGIHWAITIGALASFGWLFLAFALTRSILAGGPLMEVAELKLPETDKRKQ